MNLTAKVTIKTALKAAFCLGFVLCVCLSSAATAEVVERLDIVDRAIAFHGGEIYRNSETELDICSRSGCFHVRAKVEGEGFEYEVSGKVRDRQRRVRTTNDTVEVWLDGEPQPVAANDRQPLRDWVMARVYFAFLPYRLNDPNVFKEDLGVVDWEGRKLHKVKITFAKGSSTDAQDEYLYWFDPETGRVEQFAYSYATGRPGMRFRKPFNYREIGGLLFYDQENYAAEGALSVDLITPRFVDQSMSLLSTVTFENVEVRPLAQE